MSKSLCLFSVLLALGNSLPTPGYGARLGSFIGLGASTPIGASQIFQNQIIQFENENGTCNNVNDDGLLNSEDCSADSKSRWKVRDVHVPYYWFTPDFYIRLESSKKAGQCLEITKDGTLTLAGCDDKKEEQLLMYGSENIPVNLKSEKGKIKDKKFVFKPLFQVKTEKGDQCVRHDASIGTCDDLSVFKPYKTKLSEMEREILIQPMTGKSDGQCVAFVDKSWKLEKCDTNSSKSFTEAQVFMNDKDPVNIEGSKYIFAFLGI